MQFDVAEASRGGAVKKTARRTEELEAPQVPAPVVPLTPLALLQAPPALLQALLQAPPHAQPLEVLEEFSLHAEELQARAHELEIAEPESLQRECQELQSKVEGPAQVLLAPPPLPVPVQV